MEMPVSSEIAATPGLFGRRIFFTIDFLKILAVSCHFSPHLRRQLSWQRGRSTFDYLKLNAIHYMIFMVIPIHTNIPTRSRRYWNPLFKLEERMGSFFALLENIRNRPQMYIGDRCLLSSLRAFYNGYDMARMELGIEKTIDDKKFQKFQDWVKKKYKNEEITTGLFLTILENSENEEDGFVKFFDLFDEFNKSF